MNAYVDLTGTWYEFCRTHQSMFTKKLSTSVYSLHRKTFCILNDKIGILFVIHNILPLLKSVLARVSGSLA
jgi:hypothetical protein